MAYRNSRPLLQVSTFGTLCGIALHFILSSADMLQYVYRVVQKIAQFFLYTITLASKY